MQSTVQQQRRTQVLTELTRQHEQEEQERRDRVIAEFDGDMQAMATGILYCRRSVAQVADAIDWMRAGSPFITMGPGPHWKPKPKPVLLDGKEGECLRPSNRSVGSNTSAR
jgi:hypothetical protein